jgi:hypothetical protein
MGLDEKLSWLHSKKIGYVFKKLAQTEDRFINLEGANTKKPINCFEQFIGGPFYFGRHSAPNSLLKPTPACA